MSAFLLNTVQRYTELMVIIENMKKDLQRKTIRYKILRKTAYILRNRMTREILQRADVVSSLHHFFTVSLRPRRSS